MRINRVLPVLLCASLLGFVAARPADARLAGAGASSVTFTASGPAGMKIVGTTADLQIADDDSKVTVVVPLAGLTTGISLRDRHMREKYLEVAAYPDARLSVPRAALHFPAAAEVASDAQGTLTIHGQARPVTFHYVARAGAGAVDVTGTMRINMRDFGVQVPSYLGVTVKPEVDLVVTFRAKDT